ncbi:MAG TPA: DUF1385 domain-containing protein [Thermoleophilaceae bacterium]|nr:DUF1385 domain-containing protein [Thermoleophilaceae bacterium]
MTDEKLRLGGMALRNGLLVHGPTHWAAAVRTRDGEVKVASGLKPRLGAGAIERVPGLRGVAKLAEAMAVIPLVKRSLPEAKLPMQDTRTLAAMGAVSLTAHAIKRGAGSGTGTTEPPARVSTSATREIAVALMSVAPALFALRQGELAEWHGVEHKSIAAYEQDGQAQEAAKEHDRCGSHLVAPMLSTTVAGTLAARKAGLKGPAVDGAISLGSVAIAVEIFGWSERHSGSALARMFRRPGTELQRAVGTREPDDSQLEVGRLAMEEILRVERGGRVAEA